MTQRRSPKRTYRGTRLYGAAVLAKDAGIPVTTYTKNLFTIDDSGQNNPDDKVAATTVEETGVDNYILFGFPRGVRLTANSWTVHKGRTYKPANPEAFKLMREEICERMIPEQVNEWYKMLSDPSWSQKKLNYEGLEVTFLKEDTSITVKAYVFECFGRTQIYPNAYAIHAHDYVQREKQMYIVETVPMDDEDEVRKVLTEILKRFLARNCNMLPLKRLNVVSQMYRDLKWSVGGTRVERPEGW